MKVVSFVSAVVAALVLAATAAGSQSQPSIAISSGTLSYGGNVTFATTGTKLTGGAYAMVALSCYQDVNGDGVVDTSLNGPDIVYSQLDRPSATFSFGGASSIWVERGGGAATCRGDLYSYLWKQGVETIQLLASSGDFSVSG